MKNLMRTMLLLSLLMVSCDQVYTKYQDIPQMNWEKSNVVSLAYSTDGSEHKRILLIGFRHYALIKYGEVMVNLTITSPSGKKTSEQYIIQLRDKQTGQLEGGAMGDIVDLEVPVKEDAVFDESGTYQFEITHAMDEEVVSGIMEVGVALKANQTE